MLVLLDTSALIWWMHDDSRLGTQARQIIGDGANQIVVSAVSAHEYGIKARLRKLPALHNMRQYVEDQKFFAVGFTFRQADTIFDVPKLSWKDPFDLALIAQARQLQAVLMTSDRKILAEANQYVRCIDARV